MSAALGPLRVLRAAAVLGHPVRVGPAMDAGAARTAVEGQPVPSVDACEQGYAAGFAQGRADGLDVGHDEGWQAGQDEGLADASRVIAAEVEKSTQRAEAEAELVRSRLAEAMAALATVRTQLVKDAEDSLACLGLELAGKVLGPALVNAQSVRAQVKLLVDGAVRPVKVRVHPELADELSRLSADSGIQWIPDDAMGGGAVIVDGATSLDARLETILANFKALLVQCAQQPSQMRPSSGSDS